MADNDKAAIWGGQIRMARTPSVGQLLVGDGSGFTLTNSAGNMEQTTVGGEPYYGFAGYHGSYVTTTDMTNPVAGTTNLVSYDASPVSQYGFSLVSNGSTLSRITAAHAGVYNLQFSGQMITTGGGASSMFIWIRVNGLDVANSNTEFNLAKNGARLVAAWNWMIPLNAGQYVEIAWASSDIAVFFDAASSATYGPAIPSMITTIQLVR